MKKFKFLNLILVFTIILNLGFAQISYAILAETKEETTESEVEKENINEAEEEKIPQKEPSPIEEGENIPEAEEEKETIEEKENVPEVEEEVPKKEPSPIEEKENTEAEEEKIPKKELSPIKEKEQFLEDGIYVISSAMNSDIALDIEGNSIETGANVEIWKKNFQNNQRFRTTYLGDGYYKMEIVSSGKYLSGTSSNAKNEDNVIQSIYQDLDTQKWFLKEAGDGYYYIISKASSLYLDIHGANSEWGTNVELYEGKEGENQKFKFHKINMIQGKKTVEEKIYNISSGISFNKVIDIHRASKEDGANVEIFDRNNQANQKFKLQYDGQGYYKIVATNSGKVLTVYKSLITVGTNVEQAEDLDLDSQKWVIRSAGDGYYYIISKCNGLYLDIEGGASGSNLEVYTPKDKPWQKFKFYDTEVEVEKTVEPGNYMITTALNKSKVIDIEGNVISNGANVDIWENKNGNHQKFILTYLEDGYYTIKAFNSNKVLTIQNDSRFSGANVVQEFYRESDSQKWAIISLGNGYYSFISKSSGLALDINGGNTKDGSNLEVYERHEGENQKFQLIETEFSSTISNGKYAILASSNSNKAIDIEWGSASDGANVELWDSNGGNNQSFNIQYIGNGYYTIEATCSRKLLTVKGNNVIQQEEGDLEEQKWVIQKADTNGNYSFRNKANDQYLDIYTNDMTNGTNIEIYAGNDQYSQKFKLEELEYNGIDVSKYQLNIDWSQVRNQVDFAMLRVGFRGYGSGVIVEDSSYQKNIEEALANDINCGVYFFTQAINEKEGIEEANWVLEKIKGYDITYPIAIDTEWSSGDEDGRADWISVEDRTAAIKGFCQTIKNAGYTPIIYASKDWLENQLSMDQLTEYDVWLAHYVQGAPEQKSDYAGNYTIWQYSSQGTISGIETSVDMDICYKKYI